MNGDERLFAQDSLLDTITDTGLKIDTVIDAVTKAKAARRILLLDACRERLRLTAVRAANDGSGMSEKFAAAIAEAKGTAVFAGTTAGGYTYDDEKKNGVFTSAIITGLRGAAPADERGFITPETLSRYVNSQVHRWVEVNRPDHKEISTGIKFLAEDRLGRMPLATNPAAPIRTLDSFMKKEGV